ncbi:MAG TPA: hypothetical protein VGM01_01065 [Ktedonobacteraceae bacterium]
MQPISASQLPLEYPAAIFPSRLEWLCQPEQIEQTLRLIYYLNFWKKAHRQLLYIDRQGLSEAQAVVLEHVVSMGMVQPTVYLDGTHRFPATFTGERCRKRGQGRADSSQRIERPSDLATFRTRG